ncbi:MAG TPA: alpha/beta hydrolase [Aldersonia sp.]
MGRSVTAVLLPGTGSDALFARAAFGPALDAAGIAAVAVDPDPRRLVGSYRAALDDAAATSANVLACGISIGAAVALDWAFRHPERTVAVLAALPAWTGDPAGPPAAPAALAAAHTAGALRESGLEAVTAAMRASSPSWLAQTLARSWASQWPDLPDALTEAATYCAPDESALRAVRVPVGIAAASDDPVHPYAVAQQWAGLIPRCGLSAVTLDAIGADPAVLGRACVAALPEPLA